MGANNIVDVAREGEEARVFRISVEHAKNVTIQGAPLQFALSPDVEFWHGFLVQFKICLLNLIAQWSWRDTSDTEQRKVRWHAPRICWGHDQERATWDAAHSKFVWIARDYFSAFVTK